MLLLLWQTGRLTEAGYRLRELQREREDWSQRGYLVEAELARRQSLSLVAEAARERLGMVAADRFLFVQVQSPSERAGANSLLAAQAPSPSEAAGPAESFGHRIRRLLRLESWFP